MNCPHCQKELPADHKACVCPFCLQNLAASPGAKSGDGSADKSAAWAVFWTAFILTPVLTLGLIGSRSSMILALPILGAIVAGFALAKVYSKSTAAFIASGILYTFLVVLIYGGILFIGCVVLLSNSHI